MRLAERIGGRSEWVAAADLRAVSVLVAGGGRGLQCCKGLPQLDPGPAIVLMDRGMERSFWDSLSFSAKTLMVLGCSTDCCPSPELLQWPWFPQAFSLYLMAELVLCASILLLILVVILIV